MELTRRHVSCELTDVAVCRSGAGIASDAGAIVEVRGPRTAIDAFARRAVGRRLAPGRSAPAFGAWWVRTGAGSVVVLSTGLPAPALRATVHRGPASTDDLVFADVSDEQALMAVAGPRAHELADRAGGRLSATAVVRATGELVLLTVRRAELDACRGDLLDVGRDLGATEVDPRSLRLLAAAAAVVDCERTARLAGPGRRTSAGLAS